MSLNIFFLKTEKSKAIAVVALIVIGLTAAFVYEGIRLHSRTIDKIIHDEERSIATTIKAINLYSFAPYEQRIVNLLATHKGVPKALLDQDRDTLYRLTLPLYQALKRENKFLYIMHFHRPDGRSFLRMHKPKEFDDDLREIRPAVQHVQQTKTPLTCYEIGIHGAFYRIIQPVFYHGTYAGVLELGIRVHTILESLQKKIPGPLATFYMAGKWQKATTPLEHHYLTFGKYTLNTHGDPLYSQLPRDLDLLRDKQRLILHGKSYLLHAYQIFKDFQGKPLGGFVVMQDISQALSAKKTFIFRSLAFGFLLLTASLFILHFTFGKLIGKLERSQSFWIRTFDAIGDIVTIMNSEFQIIKANKAAYKLLDAKPGTLTGKLCYEVFNNRSSVCDGCPGVAAIQNNKAYSAEIEHQHLKKSFLITTSPILDENDEFTNIIHIAKDITKQKELGTKLQQSQKMEAIGTLAGGIAHDFNNILTSISGYSQLAIMKAYKAGYEQKIINDLKQIDIASERAKDLVNQILTFSRQTKHTKRPFQISVIIKEALQLLRSLIPATIEIKQSIKGQGNILADPTQIHQIVMNLATNAYHAMMKTGGILGVSTHEVTIDGKGIISDLEIMPGKYICLEVSDTGCGIDEETKRKIFEPYFTTKEIGKGTGLGLAVVHGIVTDHHGYINVYSEPGKGTTFHVYLPTIEEEPVDYLPQPDQEPVRGGSERIMFIDDEEMIVQLASEVLSTYGYKTTIFTNGVQALQDFEKHPDEFDLIITDMSMPNMTGLQLSQKIKEIRPNISIILCSGYSKTIYKEKALAMGISKYIQKPLIMDNLARVVRELLDIDR